MKPDPKQVKKMEEDDKYLLDEKEIKDDDKKFRRLSQRITKLVSRKKISAGILKKVRARKKERIKALKKKRR
ncbi:hypothetical protein HOK51_05240 [Candidatus Woesearchaeota archaeon]|jgi:hypothetical protein|nr:hypothetical protein [Candidatus Woesearchaeota archaeon]MBT6519232.1 hypothetical protein [Candidatus Woesearchaeota archaeon]MBT7367009.1 hypothetical protein [Candidatus Woesearchaeota archaeon]